MARNIKETIEKTEVVPHGRSLRSDATVGRLVGDHFLHAYSTALCVWLLAVQAVAACSARILPRALCSCVPPGALPSSLHARC